MATIWGLCSHCPLPNMLQLSAVLEPGQGTCFLG